MRRVQDPNRPACEDCKTFHEGKGRQAPCDECLPDLDPENFAAVDVYLMACGQVITGGMGTPIDLNVLAVIAIMDEMGIRENRRRTLTRVMNVWRRMNEEKNLERGE